MATKEQYDLENEQDFTIPLEFKYKHLPFKKEYPEKGINVKIYEYDCSPSIGGFVNSFLTGHTINKMTGWMSDQIILGKNGKYSKFKLKQMIKKNPHLHNIIKTNLLENLETCYQ